MKTVEASTLGFKLNVQVPETVEEFDTLAKAVGAALEYANRNVLYRSVFAKFRASLSEAVENQTSIPRKTEQTGKKVKDDEGNDTDEDQERYCESEKIYFDRVVAKLVKTGEFENKELAAASFGALAQKTIDTIAFDPSEPERAASGPRKVAKSYVELAQKASDNGKLEALANALREKLGNSWRIEDTVDSVAKAVSEDQRRIREATKLTLVYSV